MATTKRKDRRVRKKLNDKGLCGRRGCGEKLLAAFIRLGAVRRAFNGPKVGRLWCHEDSGILYCNASCLPDRGSFRPLHDLEVLALVGQEQGKS